jgi:hypothetical protein
MATQNVIVAAGSSEERCAGACSGGRAPTLLLSVAKRADPPIR